MSSHPPMSGATGTNTAVKHALAWLVIGNAVGLYLSLLLLHPAWQAGEWSYGRWLPVHLNVHLYGWTSLPLIAWLLAIYEVDRSRLAAWAPASVWAWSAALAAGSCYWLGGTTSGKIFLDWTGGALWAFIAAQLLLWGVLAAAWHDRSVAWRPTRRRFAALGLLGLALVPLALVVTASPTTYPPIDRTTGGPTGSSLLGSTLVVIGLMLLLPRVLAGPRCGPTSQIIPWFYAASWLVFGVTEARGGTHYDPYQMAAMCCLLPWFWWLPWDWSGFHWPAGSRAWRIALFGWWGLLVVSGLAMYQPGILDRLKFTQGLVAHSHLAMAGFTTSFCVLLLILITDRRIGSTASVVVWHTATLGMIVTLAVMGWREGADANWMITQPLWRETGLLVRTCFGGLMLTSSVLWLRERTL